MGKRTWLNVSKRGVSVSQKVGPVTVNSRGRTNIRLGKGIGYRGGCLVILALPLVAGALAATLGLWINRSL